MIFPQKNSGKLALQSCLDYFCSVLLSNTLKQSVQASRRHGGNTSSPQLRQHTRHTATDNIKKQDNMIEINDISFRYPGTKHDIYSGFSLTRSENRIYGCSARTARARARCSTSSADCSAPAKAASSWTAWTRRRYAEMLSDMFIVPRRVRTSKDFARRLCPD